MHFNINFRDVNSKARSGVIQTAHGQVETPIFMPVGTQGTVKGVHQHELDKEVKAQIILGNTFHLFLRPGIEVIEKAGGLHKFISWDKPMLTDSGGYQVYSLSSSRKINEEGVRFQSHLDGSYHFFTPEGAIQIQQSIGADIIMAFDECTPYPCDYSYAKKSMELTHRWLDRCIKEFSINQELHGYSQALFPIVQGSVYKDLRSISAEKIASVGAEGNAIGGLSVGEPEEELYAMTEHVCDILPLEKPRYLMGVGTPANLLNCVALGIDMFDCVMPSRNARHGQLFTWNGIINIKNEKWKMDFSPIDESSSLLIDKQYTKAYLRHLIKCGEYLGVQLATLHNLNFYLELMQEIRKKIKEGNYHAWMHKMIPILSQKL